MCSAAEGCQEPQTDAKPEETRDGFVTQSFYLTSKPPRSGSTHLTDQSAVFEPKPGPTETSPDANSAEKYKISVCGCLFLYHCNAVIYVSKRGRLRDIQPDWLSLTPLIWTAEAVEPRLGCMMKLPLYLAHTSLPTAASMSHPPPSIYSK